MLCITHNKNKKFQFFNEEHLQKPRQLYGRVGDKTMDHRRTNRKKKGSNCS